MTMKLTSAATDTMITTTTPSRPSSGAGGTQAILVGRDVVTASPDALGVERWRLGRPVSGGRREYVSSRILDVRSIGPDLAADKGFWQWTASPYSPGVAFDHDGETIFLAPASVEAEPTASSRL